MTQALKFMKLGTAFLFYVLVASLLVYYLFSFWRITAREWHLHAPRWMHWPKTGDVIYGKIVR